MGLKQTSNLTGLSSVTSSNSVPSPPSCSIDESYKYVFLPVCYSLTFVFSLTLNSVVLVRSCRHKRRWNTSLIYMVNLASTDLMYGLSLPFLIASYVHRDHWVFGDFMCRLVRFLFYFNLYCSIFFLTCISVHRMKGLSVLLVYAVVLGLTLAQSDPVEDAAPEEEHVELFTTPTTKMAAAASDFGYNLFRALALKESGNVFLSPISVSAVFSHISLGASERAQRQLYRSLRYHTLQDPQLHSTLSALLSSSRASGKGLSTAARVYLSRRLRLKQEFFSLVEQTYSVRPKALQGSNKDLKEINDWVSQETGGKVQRFLSQGLPRTPGLTAVSASYFKGKWVTRFGNPNTMVNFQVDGAPPVLVPMMQQDNYPIKMGMDLDLSCTIAQVPMQDSVSLFLFLPDSVTSNLTALEDTLTAEFVQDLSMTLLPAQVSLSLPMLQLGYSTNLLPLLSDIGLSDWLADPGLELISAQPVKLNTVPHRVVLETAPEGLQFASESAPPSALSYRVDRPFLFLIREENTGALLFIGRVTNPKDLRL